MSESHRPSANCANLSRNLFLGIKPPLGALWSNIRGIIRNNFQPRDLAVSSLTWRPCWISSITTRRAEMYAPSRNFGGRHSLEILLVNGIQTDECALDGFGCSELKERWFNLVLHCHDSPEIRCPTQILGGWSRNWDQLPSMALPHDGGQPNCNSGDPECRRLWPMLQTATVRQLLLPELAPPDLAHSLTGNCGTVVCCLNSKALKPPSSMRGYSELVQFENLPHSGRRILATSGCKSSVTRTSESQCTRLIITRNQIAVPQSWQH